MLGLLFGEPTRSFYASELIALAGVGSGAVQRELVRLVQSGLATVRAIGNQKHYQANPDSPIFDELCQVVRKTFGLANPLRQALAPLAQDIRAAFIYGSVAKRQDTASSDVDLMLISDKVTYAEVFSTLEAVTLMLGRRVNPTLLSPSDLAQRITHDSAFVMRVLALPKIWLIGGDDELGP